MITGARMRKKQYNLFNKIRAALRDIYRYSPMRKDAIKKASIVTDLWSNGFKCPICLKEWPIQMADIDHEPALGKLKSFEELKTWAENLYFGPVQVICKICHKAKTAKQRKKKAA